MAAGSGSSPPASLGLRRASAASRRRLASTASTQEEAYSAGEPIHQFEQRTLANWSIEPLIVDQVHPINDPRRQVARLELLRLP